MTRVGSGARMAITALGICAIAVLGGCTNGQPSGGTLLVRNASGASLSSVKLTITQRVQVSKPGGGRELTDRDYVIRALGPGEERSVEYVIEGEYGLKVVAVKEDGSSLVNDYGYVDDVIRLSLRPQQSVVVNNDEILVNGERDRASELPTWDSSR